MKENALEGANKTMQDSTQLSKPIIAAQYVRMSTDHQQYSIENQAQAIRAYAEAHNMVVVRTYTDAARSGLTLGERHSLQQLLADVEKGAPGYSVVLVYDVSRWGRFQDIDESAHYEYRCRRANIAIHYCAEAFVNDGGVISALFKALKRTMAAEYSRELSTKVFAGKARLIELGFRQGGLAGYGLRRLLVDQAGSPKLILKEGEQKNISTDRVVLVPGPPGEVNVVNEIFDLYGSKKYSPADIADFLNKRSVPWIGGRRWTRHVIRAMVTNPKYIGTNVSSRHSGKLRGRKSVNPPELWIKKEHAFASIVNPDVFAKAQAVAKLRAQKCTDIELLNYLREFLAKHGTITARKINAEWAMPCPQVYTQRFGSLMAAYRRIGFDPDRNMNHTERDRGIRAIRQDFTAAVLKHLETMGVSAAHHNQTRLIELSDQTTIRPIVARCKTMNKSHGWILRLKSARSPDFTIIARLAPGNRQYLDYFVLPRTTFGSMTQLTVRCDSTCQFEPYRTDTLLLPEQWRVPVTQNA